MEEITKCESCNRTFPTGEALAMHNAAKHSSSSPKKSLSYNHLIVVSVITIIIIGGLVFFKFNLNGQSIKEETQRITLSMKNYNYYPNMINLKQGIPTEITLDNRVIGCYRFFNIDALGVSKRSFSPSDTITFTPKEKGTFEFRCGMGMGRGIVIVV